MHHEVTVIKLKAAEAHNDFLIEYYTDLYTGKEARNKVIDRYLGNLRSSNQLVRIGFAQSIGKNTKNTVATVQKYFNHLF